MTPGGEGPDPDPHEMLDLDPDSMNPDPHR
jgi:hypothetical protein